MKSLVLEPNCFELWEGLKISTGERELIVRKFEKPMIREIGFLS